MTDSQREFMDALIRFIDDVKRMPSFRGKTQAISALKRISNLAAFH